MSGGKGRGKKEGEEGCLMAGDVWGKGKGKRKSEECGNGAELGEWKGRG